MKFEFSGLFFSKNSQISNFMKSIQQEPCCSMQADGQMDRRTDMTRLIVNFHNCMNMPNKKNLHNIGNAEDSGFLRCDAVSLGG
jgi:hypothetical protein